MSRLDTIYVGSNLTATTRPVSLVLGDIRQLTVDAGAYCGIEDTEIDSATWGLVEPDGVVTLGSSATSTKTTACPVTAVTAGVQVVQASLVFDNGEVQIFLFRCDVTDPDCSMPDRYAA
ncbi:MAG TPA: hypothetical protein VJM31_08740 [Vicinamibacterales bacterium]|nr:hypothetical protein [Vicinamibacterales bacterium]